MQVRTPVSVVNGGPVHVEPTRSIFTSRLPHRRSLLASNLAVHRDDLGHSRRDSRSDFERVGLMVS
jgi:hypothetical protein